MENGMMWFDSDNKRSLEQKIVEAARYYTAKYKRKPELVLINPTEVKPGEIIPRLPGIAIENQNIVLPHHIWIGMNP